MIFAAAMLTNTAVAQSNDLSPPPIPVLAVDTFIIIFDAGSDELVDDAEEAIEAAYNEAQRRGLRDILVTGHTDGLGEAADERSLSERRAQAVRDEMVRLGLNPDYIRTEGRGSTDPVPPQFGYGEEVNRMAVILLSGISYQGR